MKRHLKSDDFATISKLLKNFVSCWYSISFLFFRISFDILQTFLCLKRPSSHIKNLVYLRLSAISRPFLYLIYPVCFLQYLKHRRQAHIFLIFSIYIAIYPDGHRIAFFNIVLNEVCIFLSFFILPI